MVRSNSKNFRTNSTKHRNCFENIEQSNYRKWVYDRAVFIKKKKKKKKKNSKKNYS